MTIVNEKLNAFVNNVGNLKEILIDLSEGVTKEINDNKELCQNLKDLENQIVELKERNSDLVDETYELRNQIKMIEHAQTLHNEQKIKNSFQCLDHALLIQDQKNKISNLECAIEGFQKNLPWWKNVKLDQFPKGDVILRRKTQNSYSEYYQYRLIKDSDFDTKTFAIIVHQYEEWIEVPV